MYTKAIVLREKDMTTDWLCIPDTIVQDKSMHIKLVPSYSFRTRKGRKEEMSSASGRARGAADGH